MMLKAFFSQMFASTLLLSFAACAAAQYSATYLPDTAPDHTEEGQTGTNKCGTNSSQSSMCQNAYSEFSLLPFERRTVFHVKIHSLPCLRPQCKCGG